MDGQSLELLQVRKGFVLVARVVSYLIYFYLIVVEIILLIGFFLLLFGANPSAGFTQWAYRNLDRVMAPFRGIFTPIQIGTTSDDVAAVFDTSVLFAMIVYGILAMLLGALTRWVSQRLRYLDAAEAEAERRERLERVTADEQASRVAPTTTATTTDPPMSGAPQRLTGRCSSECAALWVPIEPRTTSATDHAFVFDVYVTLMMPTYAMANRVTAPTISTVPRMPRSRPALAMPLLSGERLPASIAASSLLPIHHANGPKTPEAAMARMPRTRTAVALLFSG